jgi:hypothetical protein
MKILKKHNKANISRGQTPLFFSAKRNNVSKESAKEKKQQKTNAESQCEKNKKKQRKDQKLKR